MLFAVGGLLLGAAAHFVYPAWGIVAMAGMKYGLIFYLTKRFYQFVVEMPYLWLVLTIGIAIRRNAGKSTDSLRVLRVLTAPIIDPIKARGVQLPMPMHMSDPDADREVLVRSQAMAGLISKDALQKGLHQVHIITGFYHAEQIAWFLTHASPPGKPVDR